MTMSDLGKIFSDTKLRAVSLRQLSFLLRHSVKLIGRPTASRSTAIVDLTVTRAVSATTELLLFVLIDRITLDLV